MTPVSVSKFPLYRAELRILIESKQLVFSIDVSPQYKKKKIYTNKNQMKRDVKYNIKAVATHIIFHEIV